MRLFSEPRVRNFLISHIYISDYPRASFTGSGGARPFPRGSHRLESRGLSLLWVDQLDGQVVRFAAIGPQLHRLPTASSASADSRS